MAASVEMKLDFTSNGFAVLSFVLISLSSYTCGQIQCPAPFVRVFPNGTADFDSLPPGGEDVDPVYDPGAIGGWYDLAEGFVDAVRPGSLPYSKCFKLTQLAGERGLQLPS